MMSIKGHHTCDVCGKNRNSGSHDKCSKMRQKRNLNKNTKDKNERLQ